MSNEIEVQNKSVASDEVEGDEGVLEGLSEGAAQWLDHEAEELVVEDRERLRFGAGHDCIEIAVFLPGDDRGVQERIWRRPLVLCGSGLVPFINCLNETINVTLGTD